MPIEPPVVSEETLVLYRAGAKQRVESFLGGVSDSHFKTTLAALLVGGVMFGLTLGLMEWLERFEGGFLGEVFEAVIAGVLSAVLVWVLFDIARTRRMRLMLYVQQVADLNHHVRNALQVIRFQTAISKDEAEAVARINESVKRIDDALRNMYPLIVDHDPMQGPPEPR